MKSPISNISRRQTFVSAVSSISTALLSEQIGLCRICLEETDNRTLLKPCNCKGTQAFAHEICLDMWIKTSHQTACETCLTNYEMEYKGMKAWYNCSLPRPLSPEWEDEADFFCAFLWSAIIIRVTYLCLMEGLRGFHNSILDLFGSNRTLTGFWWFSLIANSIYYSQILFQIFVNWKTVNSIYDWKIDAKPRKKKTN